MRSTKRLGCLSGTGIIAAVLTLVVIAGYAYAQGGLLYNPGPLNAQGGEMLGGVTSHAEIGGNCKACHAAPWDPAKMEDRCMDCHADITVEIQSMVSMHGSLLHENPGLSCRHCHAEHRGPDARLTEMTDTTFPHETVGYSLKVHQLTVMREAFACSDCHGNDITKFDLQTCDTCHRQNDQEFMTVHTTSYGSACLDCHDGVDNLAGNFNHNQVSFKLVGSHANLECVKCHMNAHKLSDFALVSTDCISCHRNDDPHKGRFGQDCAVCHSVSSWKTTKFDHNLSIFKLEGSHADVRCEQCHVDGVYKGTPTDCFSCHKKDDEHNGRFGTNCAGCHKPTKWDDANFDHNLSNFPLTGLHVDLACEKCHINAQFAGLSTACSSCHADPVFHAGMFGLECATCHSTNNWYTSYNGPHPGIADEGGRGINHGGATCRDCHTQTLRSATCVACHSSNNKGEGGGGGDD